MIDSPTSTDAYDERGAPNAAAQPRARLSGAERRQVILSAARREFARAGYHGASTACIAQAAGCSEPMLYKHFAGKQALFAETLAEVNSVIERRFDELFGRDGDLVANLYVELPAIMADSAYAEMMQLRKHAITLVDEPPIRVELAAIQDRHMGRVTKALARAAASGTARADIDPEYVAWVWAGIVLAACQREAMEPGGFVQMLPHALTFLDSLRP
ncbi:MAG: TetR/AcrR family transcriptional regulator [Thermoleophilia bacterium]|nr:TetR/AcrR family transcriptional regulator [Thermoleophilia bacterium]